MSRFKVGDIVIAKPHNGYGVTTNGWTGKVTEIVNDDKIRVVGIRNGGTYCVNAVCFELAPFTGYESKKEENIMELLKIYVDRNIKRIKEEKEQKVDDLLKKDEINKKVKAFEKELNEQYNTYTNLTLIHSSHTEETDKKLRELEEAENTAIIELDRKIEEVEAQLKLCETYEQKIDILASYDIINKKTKALNA